MRRWNRQALVQVIACRLFHAKPLPEPMVTCYQLDEWEETTVKSESKFKTSHSWKCFSKCRLRNGGYFVSGRWVNVFHGLLIFRRLYWAVTYAINVLGFGFCMCLLTVTSFFDISEYIVDHIGLQHDDVMKWKPFARYWPFVRGIHRSPVSSPHKGQSRGALMFSLICVWINGWSASE